jgi:hypothetical protein
MGRAMFRRLLHARRIRCSKPTISPNPTFDEGSQEELSASYGQYTNYQTARSIKLTVEYNKRF